MTDDLRSGSISQYAAAVATSPGPRPASRPTSRKPYATLVFMLTSACTLVAMFDLLLFATGGR
jgi:hypothetical protein